MYLITAMELDITALIAANVAPRYFASIAETGNPNIGADTWNAAKDAAVDVPLLKTSEECDAAREYFVDFGEWSEDELAAMPDAEINALTLQYIAGDIREMESFGYREYARRSKAGTCSGNIYKQGRRFYFTLSH